MQTTLILTAPLLQANANRISEIAAAVEKSTNELHRDIVENIQRSVPAGRTYARTAIVRKASRRTDALKLARRRGGSAVVVGYNFHRASRRGQPPAILSGRLVNSIRPSRISALHGRIGVGVNYALPLDDPEGLDRPFFTSRVQLYRPTFFENIRRAYVGK